MGSSLRVSYSLGPSEGTYAFFAVTLDHAGASKPAVMTATVGGQPMQLLGAAEVTDSLRLELWGRGVAPASGYTFQIAFTSAPNLVYRAAILRNVSSAAPTGPFVSAPGGPPAIAIDVPSAPGDLVLDVLGARAGPVAPGAGQTQRWSGSDVVTGAGSTRPGAAPSQRMSWTLPAGAPAAILGGVSFRAR
jgi:hypothetical protein